MSPEEIRLNAAHTELTLSYPNEIQYILSAEYLRVYSPSSEVRGHGVGRAILQTGKRAVEILDLEMVGNYALKITFSDGHDSGLYDWAYLRDLGEKQAVYWQDYLDRLAEAGASRDIDLSLLNKKMGKSCGSGHCH